VFVEILWYHDDLSVQPNCMLPQRRFWKAEQTLQTAFSKRFSTISSSPNKILGPSKSASKTERFFSLPKSSFGEHTLRVTIESQDDDCMRCDCPNHNVESMMIAWRCAFPTTSSHTMMIAWRCACRNTIAPAVLKSVRASRVKERACKSC